MDFATTRQRSLMLQITAAIHLPKHTVVGLKRYVKMPKKNTTLVGGVFFGASSRNSPSLRLGLGRL